MKCLEFCLGWSFPALHSWPAAPEPVHYLRQLHRHLFHVAVQLRFSLVTVDRQLEFIMLQDLIREAVHAGQHLLADAATDLPVLQSCEQYAEQAVTYIVDHYQPLYCRVEVREDEGPAAAIIWTPGEAP